MEMGVYKSSRSAAENAAEAIRDALRAVGVPESETEVIRPHVLSHGRPIVNLGTWHLDVIEKMAAALQLGAAVLEAQAKQDT